ncbi:Toxin PezT [Paramyrothecium foliicola]|nr:Toxin PezT [Paramyrothecium foliicola]
MAPPDLSSYQLSEEESKRIFVSHILPAELGDTADASTRPTPVAATAQPLAVLAVGQTGAGKTRLAPALLAALSAAGHRPAHFIADTYKAYHPSYPELVKDAPQLASPATGPDARRWLAMAASEAVSRRLDVFLESACRHPFDFIQLARIFREANYRVEVALLAVPAALSRLGLLTRYYEKLPESHSGKLPVRLTPVKVHDDSYQGLLDAASFLDVSGIADQVVVVRRGNKVAFGWEKDGQATGSIAEAVQKERIRPLTPDEAKVAQTDIKKLQEHADAAEQVEQVVQLLKPLIGPAAETRSGGFPPLQDLEFGGVSGNATSSDAYILRLGSV